MANKITKYESEVLCSQGVIFTILIKCYKYYNSCKHKCYPNDSTVLLSTHDGKLFYQKWELWVRAFVYTKKWSKSHKVVKSNWGYRMVKGKNNPTKHVSKSIDVFGCMVGDPLQANRQGTKVYQLRRFYLKKQQILNF